MKMEVYVDTLFLVNLVMNYIILWTTAKLASLSVKNWRLLLGASLGGLYSIFILLPNFIYLNSLWIKLIFAGLIPLVSFFPLSPRSFLRVLGYFYLSSFLAGGTAMALVYFGSHSPYLSYLGKGFTYVNHFNIWTMIITIITIVFLVHLAWMARQRKNLEDLFSVPITLFFADQKIELEAMVDTGNQLKDPLTGTPVIIAEYKALIPILPDEIKEIFETIPENDLEGVYQLLSKSPWCARFRLIPFTSLGKANGMLLGFRPDEIIVREKGQRIKVNKAIVGIYNKSFSLEGNYQALLHPEIFQVLVENK